MLRRMIFPALLAATAPFVTPLTAAADIPAVTADTPIAHSFVAMVLGDLGTPVLLLERGGDPHHVQLRPSQARAVANADLVIWSGAGLTPWMARVVDTLSDNTVLDLSAVNDLHTNPLQRTVLFDAGEEGGDGHDHGEHEEHNDHDHAMAEHDAPAGHDHEDHDGHEDHDHVMDDHDAPAGHDDHDHEDHAEHDSHDDHAGHDHGAIDPHLWMTPENAAPWLAAIAAQLSALDPENATAFTANAAAAQTEIEGLTAEMIATLAPVGDAGLVMYHAAYGYFGEAFGLNILGTIALGDAADPGAARIAALRGALTDANAACIFPEVNHGAGYVTVVVEGTDLRIGAPLDPAGVMLDPGPGLYAQTMRGLAQSIADCVAAR